MLSSLSIVLPARDHAGRLPDVVAGCLAVAARHSAAYELIIVADGDRAAAAEAARLAATHAPVLALQHRSQQGLRHSLREAWAVASGGYILALDPERAAVDDLPRLLALADGYAAVFGARTPPPRGPLAALGALVARQATGSRLRDPALPLALARADLGDLIAPHGPDALVMAELEAGARRRGLAVAEVAVAPRPRPLAAGRQRAAGLGLLIVAGCLWLLRRLRRPGP
jgi:hypothetical protein